MCPRGCRRPTRTPSAMRLSEPPVIRSEWPAPESRSNLCRSPRVTPAEEWTSKLRNCVRSHRPDAVSSRLMLCGVNQIDGAEGSWRNAFLHWSSCMRCGPPLYFWRIRKVQRSISPKRVGVQRNSPKSMQPMSRRNLAICRRCANPRQLRAIQKRCFRGKRAEGGSRSLEPRFHKDCRVKYHGRSCEQRS